MTHSSSIGIIPLWPYMRYLVNFIIFSSFTFTVVSNVRCHCERLRCASRSAVLNGSNQILYFGLWNGGLLIPDLWALFLGVHISVTCYVKEIELLQSRLQEKFTRDSLKSYITKWLVVILSFLIQILRCESSVIHYLRHSISMFIICIFCFDVKGKIRCMRE